MAKAELVKNKRSEFEKALGNDMKWLAKKLSAPEVCEDITTPNFLKEADKRGLIVKALVRTLELDKNDEDFTLLLTILEEQPKLYQRAIEGRWRRWYVAIYACSYSLLAM